jgi:hypothetical protein
MMAMALSVNRRRCPVLLVDEIAVLSSPSPSPSLSHSPIVPAEVGPKEGGGGCSVEGA